MQNDSQTPDGLLQPNSQHCFVCGVSNPFGLHLRFFETAPDEVTAYVTLPDHFQGYPGITHGGIIAAMLDEVAGRSHMGAGENPRLHLHRQSQGALPAECTYR